MVRSMFEDVKGLEKLSYIIDKSYGSEILISESFGCFDIDFYKDNQDQLKDFIQIDNGIVINIETLRKIIKFYDIELKTKKVK